MWDGGDPPRAARSRAKRAFSSSSVLLLVHTIVMVETMSYFSIFISSAKSFITRVLFPAAGKAKTSFDYVLA